MTGTLGYLNTGTTGQWDIQTMEHRDTGTHGELDAGIMGHGDTVTLGHRDTAKHTHTYI